MTTITLPDPSASAVKAFKVSACQGHQVYVHGVSIDLCIQPDEVYDIKAVGELTKRWEAMKRQT